MVSGPVSSLSSSFSSIAAVLRPLSLPDSLRFNHRPQSSHFLSRSYAHFTSFVVLAVVWLGEEDPYTSCSVERSTLTLVILSSSRQTAVGIMLATQMPWECSAKTLWCAAASFSSALAFCTSFFCEFNRLVLSFSLFLSFLSPCLFRFGFKRVFTSTRTPMTEILFQIQSKRRVLANDG